jgi:hypothetical protein
MTEEERADFQALIERKLAETVFIVEATDLERLMLWRDHAERTNWQQDNPGTMIIAGHLDGRPVCVTLTWEIQCGQRVLFWEATSEVVDYKMIKAWFAQNTHAPDWGGGRPARCNASNFHHCLDAIGAYDDEPRAPRGAEGES